MQQQAVIRPGMLVLGSDGAEVGTVEQVLVSPDGQDVRLLLAGGQIRLSPQVIGLVGRDELHLRLAAATAHSTAWGPIPDGYTPTESFTWQRTSAGGADSVTVQRIEERLVPDKRWTEIGSVRVHKSVIEEPQTLTVEVAREEYDVERVAVERPWQPGDDAPHTEGETIVVPVVSERLEVIRHRLVTEEVRLTKRRVTEQRQLTETVRKEVIEATGPISGEEQSSAESTG